MRRDAIFYTIFKRVPGLFFELVEQPPAEASSYRFESVEVKEPTFRIDGVFLPSPDAASQMIFFAEVQFQRDELLYHRFFSESMLYMYRNPSLYDDWYGVIILQSRSLEPENTTIHRSLLNSSQVQRIYLDELGSPDEQKVGISLMQLTIASDNQMVQEAKRLIERVQQEQITVLAKKEIIDVITTIAVYKFANLSREEVEAMLGVKLEETRVYQEAKQEGLEQGLELGREQGRELAKLELVPRFLARGMSMEEVAQLLNLTIEQVRLTTEQESSTST
ncbi:MULTISPECIES: Rpn family recombination-promoting nuclease/putative transposase [Nostoc]|uniref:Rpn family recombination-promoting nuclease/putative transposase n=2 Tax=Nostoc TaxID=1177 RepID=A0ABR8I929_9NOSO|nr:MULTISPECIES: Rpn family recombination-promoting nuclease/putative transposase [Nostoc]MBD2560461.1 Rpn family recombination-promoting nuclease/putative transposase [Nostoc linckia FACHB-391]MBD2646965.1 Rpn family recombination-promoting nuclease/putative transposase [Nostoc foliaceum FACHB-393]